MLATINTTAVLGADCHHSSLLPVRAMVVVSRSHATRQSCILRSTSYMICVFCRSLTCASMGGVFGWQAVSAEQHVQSTSTRYVKHLELRVHEYLLCTSTLYEYASYYDIISYQVHLAQLLYANRWRTLNY